MPRNGTGTYTLPQAPFVAGTVISSAAVNDDLSDIASALTGSLPRDGQAGMTGQLKNSDGSNLTPSMTFSTETNTGFYRPAPGKIGISILGTEIVQIGSGGIETGILGVVPIGVVLDFAGTTLPTGWLLCDGSAKDKTVFANLFAVLGTTYGSTSSTFNVPDFRGAVGVGRADMGGTPTTRLTSGGYGANPATLGQFGGVQVHSITLSEIPPNITSSNTGGISFSATSAGAGGTTPSGWVNNGGNPTASFAPGGGGSSGYLTGTVSFVGAVNVIGALAVNAVPVTSNNTGFGGGVAPIGLVQPSIIMNKIIFAGSF